MNRFNKIISFVYRFIKAVFRYVIRVISKGIRKIIKAISILCNPLIKRKWSIIFVLILPIIGNYFLVTYIERGTCRFELPLASHQDDLIACDKVLSGIDPLSRINPDLAELLRYNVSIKNNWQAVNDPANTTTSTLIFLVKDEKSGEKKRVSAGESYIIERNLSHSKAVDKLGNYEPVIEFPASGGMNDGGWELSYQPDVFSVVIQFVIILIAWFQLVEIYVFIRLGKLDCR